MKKIFSLVLVFILLVGSFTSVFAEEAKTVEKKLATAVWSNVKYNYMGEEVTLKITLTGVVGNQLDANQVSFEEYDIKYLDGYEDDPQCFEETVVDGTATSKWNGKGELVDNGVVIIPIASGATLSIEVVNSETSVDFFPGYYAFIDDDKKVICNGMGQAYSISTDSPKTFNAELTGEYDDSVKEFPITLSDKKLGLLIVNPDKYPLPTEKTDEKDAATAEVKDEVKDAAKDNTAAKDAETTDKANEVVTGLDNFKAVKEYTDATFTDITGSEWFVNDVKAGYEFGIVTGKENNTFDPQGKITVAEALAMAVRTSKIYSTGDGTLDTSGANWYDGIIVYALEKEIIKDGEFEDFNKYATRAELASFFASAVAPNEYTAINDIKTLPDVDESTQYSKKIFTLYNAGIITGSDEYGTFNSDAEITRAEASAIINRVIKSENRKVVEFKEKDQ